MVFKGDIFNSKIIMKSHYFCAELHRYEWTDGVCVDGFRLCGIMDQGADKTRQADKPLCQYLPTFKELHARPTMSQ